jgi:hypothetical protein
MVKNSGVSDLRLRNMLPPKTCRFFFATYKGRCQSGGEMNSPPCFGVPNPDLYGNEILPE